MIIVVLPGLKTYEIAFPAGKSSVRKRVSLFLHTRKLLPSVWGMQQIPHPKQWNQVGNFAIARANTKPEFKCKNGTVIEPDNLFVLGNLI